MSRIGKKPIKLPSDVNVQIESGCVIISGPKGQSSLEIPTGISVVLQDSMIVVQQKNGNAATFGRIRAQLNNCVQGVTEGWKRVLEIIGTGYRASTDGKTLTLALGFSHPVVIQAPQGIEFQVAQNKVSVIGSDKQLIGEVAARIRRVRPPDSYKGKGVRFEGEYVRKKPGKTAKGAGGA